MNIFSRAKSAYRRINWCSRFTKNPLYSVFYLFSYKFDRSKVAQGHYNRIPFFFRGGDIEALKEVLIDGEYTILSDYIKNKDRPVILDLGHHIGTFALWCFSQNRNATLLGVEAGQDTYMIAVKNMNSGKVHNFDWSLMHRAAWKNDDIISFASEGHSLGHRVKKDGNAKVRGVTFPELLKLSGGRCDLIKIDIEGAEEEFLAAHPECLQAVDALIIEIHPHLCSEANVTKILEKNFSNIQNVQKRPQGKPILWCQKK